MKDKIKINALYFPSRQSKGIIFYFHGNAESLRNWGYIASDFLLLDWDLFIIDYRGFGKSTGEPYEDKLYSDAFEIYDYLKTRFPSKEILPYGRSIGTAIAAKLALEKKTQRLILETPYTSLPELARIYFPFIPSFILSYRLNTFDYVKNYLGRVLVLHGSHDEIIPVEMGREFQNLGNKVIYVEIPYGNHNNLSQFKKFKEAVRSFLVE
ncbi:MAG: lysophospholipase, partial [Leptospiraceae bacterium]|nr:lysophospholipase [Leptospiraceae bacterium]